MQNTLFWRKNENKFGFWKILYYICIAFEEKSVRGVVKSVPGVVYVRRK